MDKSEVFSTAGSYFYFFLTTFSCLIFKKEEIAVWHLAITLQMRSVIAGDFLCCKILALLV